MRVLPPLIPALLCLALCGSYANAAPVTQLSAGSVRLEYDRGTGTASIVGPSGARLSGFHSAVRLDGRLVTSRDYARRSVSRKGSVLTVTLTGSNMPAMTQRFTAGAGFVTVRVEVSGRGLRSNYMAPVVAQARGCLDIGASGDARALRVPFDNDQWTRYDASSLGGPGTSYEVTAFYENQSRRGVIVGSLTHDTWKTAIAFNGVAGRVDALTVFGGAADGQTRDVEPHGTVTGIRLRSPEVMVGFYPDWRDGLEVFARENARRAPMLPWSGGVPFGWNSWGKVQKDLDYETAAATSDFFAERMQDTPFGNGSRVYINLDSYWDNLSQDELRRFVRHVHARGQRAGIYWAPFAYWGSDLSRTVEGSDAAYADAVLRTRAGTPLSLDGAFALDPTHPATRRRMDVFIGRFLDAGFDYVKLDFLSHGALEGGSANGRHFDTTAQTGIQAYHSGMKYLLEKIGGRMFVSAAISPLFPHGYAHARRISCDAYGGIGETEYMMNSAAYGWWASGTLYAFNDPDHLVLEGHGPAENRSRVTSGAIAGTVFLSGDDVTRPDAAEKVTAWLTNPAINELAGKGRAFRPVEGNTGSGAPEVLTLRDGAAWYVAVFNYAAAPASKTLDLARAGLDADRVYHVTDLWTGRSKTCRASVEVSLDAAEATILKLVPSVP